MTTAERKTALVCRMSRCKLGRSSALMNLCRRRAALRLRRVVWVSWSVSPEFWSGERERERERHRQPPMPARILSTASQQEDGTRTPVGRHLAELGQGDELLAVEGRRVQELVEHVRVARAVPVPVTLGEGMEPVLPVERVERLGAGRVRATAGRARGRRRAGLAPGGGGGRLHGAHAQGVLLMVVVVVVVWVTVERRMQGRRKRSRAEQAGGVSGRQRPRRWKGDVGTDEMLVGPAAFALAESRRRGRGPGPSRDAEWARAGWDWDWPGASLVAASARLSAPSHTAPETLRPL